MAPPSLPLDVIDDVCGFLDTAALLSLRQANSIFSPFVQRRVYRHISLHSYSQAVKCLRAMSATPVLAHYIRSFTIRLNPEVLIFSSFVKLLSTALSSMKNVTNVDIVLPPSAARALSPSFSSAGDQTVTYPHMKRLSCNFPLNQALSGFLQKTPMLTELELGGNGVPSPDVLPAAALPQLSAFVGSCEDAASIVPGRPLEMVQLYSGELTEEVLCALYQSSKPLAVFGAITNSLSPALMDSVVRCLPHVRHLRIMSINQSMDIPPQLLYPHMTRMLSALPELKSAELAGIRWASQSKEKASGKAQSSRGRRSSAKFKSPRQ